MPGGGAVKRSHPCENMRDSDIKGSTADGNGDGQKAAPSEPNESPVADKNT
ncbi:hypothetical protein DY000_02050997 [Brassica cretica]|uniref:Uncharacterized protein n=1 Tax=Brassica cretica TaxID=69181 RepID=A0ABQ7EV73_BRACR|nr:hypothetical protein DY000_02050997 [Brassica cretica]